MWFVQLLLCLKSFNSASIINYVQKSLQELKGAQPFNTKAKHCSPILWKLQAHFEMSSIVKFKLCIVIQKIHTYPSMHSNFKKDLNKLLVLIMIVNFTLDINSLIMHLTNPSTFLGLYHFPLCDDLTTQHLNFTWF